MIADTDFGAIDVGYANISRARVGNRLLSRFLVTIDYGQAGGRAVAGPADACESWIRRSPRDDVRVAMPLH